MTKEGKVFDEDGKFDSGNLISETGNVGICHSAWVLGYSVLCELSVIVGHRFRIMQPNKVEWTYVLYRVQINFLHFKHERLVKYLRAIYEIPNFDKLHMSVIEGTL